MADHVRKCLLNRLVQIRSDPRAEDEIVTLTWSGHRRNETQQQGAAPFIPGAMLRVKTMPVLPPVPPLRGP